MIKNYFKTAWRNLWKNKALSFINIFGLASGMACSLLIFLFVTDSKISLRPNANKFVSLPGYIDNVLANFGAITESLT